MSTVVDVNNQINSFLSGTAPSATSRVTADVYTATISEADVGKVFTDPVGVLEAAGIKVADSTTILVTSTRAGSAALVRVVDKKEIKLEIKIGKTTITLSITW